MEFIKFDKITRLKRNCVITEKIDGTNAQIFITSSVIEEPIIEIGGRRIISDKDEEFIEKYCLSKKDNLFMFAGSRNRWLSPTSDNHGFAKWVQTNSDDLFALGEGRHFGEWWGKGIQRGYAMEEKVFSLFNSGRWVDRNTIPELNEDDKMEHCPSCCRIVPVLYEGVFSTEIIDETLNKLKQIGSVASPGFMKPEGVVIYHCASRMLFKQTIENDESPKLMVENG